jgi:hypothetical protein
MKNGASDLTQQVAELWEKAVEEELANSSEVSFDAFLGAQYSIASLAGQCTITDEGMEIVQVALEELQELIDGNSEDDEEDEEDEDE